MAADPYVVVATLRTLYGYASGCSVHGITAYYTNEAGAALDALGHATTFHGPDPRGSTLSLDRPTQHT